MSELFIAVPCMDNVSAVFAHSLATLDHDGEVVFQIGSLVYEAREALAKKAMEYDEVLWLDSDMSFPTDTITQLRRHNADIASGVYYKRTMPYNPNVFSKLVFTGSNIEWEIAKDIPDKPFKAEGAGMGCMLMKTKVLKDIKDRYGTVFNPIGGVGEDIMFCLRARSCGYEILLDPTVELGHIGTAIVNKQTYETYRRITNE